jgi:hypothetical protein
MKEKTSSMSKLISIYFSSSLPSHSAAFFIQMLNFLYIHVQSMYLYYGLANLVPYMWPCMW